MAAQNAPQDEYELARRRAQQQSTAAVQGQKEALQRRFASLGNLQSGAAIKQEQLAEQQGQEQLQQANEAINAAERAEKKQLDLIKQQQQFAREERLGTQDFASKERLGAQDFANKERLGSQEYTAGESLLSRELQKKIAGDQIEEAKASRIQTGDLETRKINTQVAQFAVTYGLEEEKLGVTKQQMKNDQYIKTKTLDLQENAQKWAEKIGLKNYNLAERAQMLEEESTNIAQILSGIDQGVLQAADYNFIVDPKTGKLKITGYAPVNKSSSNSTAANAPQPINYNSGALSINTNFR